MKAEDKELMEMDPEDVEKRGAHAECTGVDAEDVGVTTEKNRSGGGMAE